MNFYYHYKQTPSILRNEYIFFLSFFMYEGGGKEGKKMHHRNVIIASFYFFLGLFLLQASGLSIAYTPILYSLQIHIIRIRRERGRVHCVSVSFVKYVFLLLSLTTKLTPRRSTQKYREKGESESV